MESRLNIDTENLWSVRTAAETGNDFPLGDYMQRVDQGGSDLQRNWGTTHELRDGLSNKATEYAGEAEQNAAMHSPGSDPKLMVEDKGLTSTPDLSLVPYDKDSAAQLGTAAGLRKQASGFNNTQVREDFTFGVVANAATDTLVGSRVYTETPKLKIAGTVIAVGDAEFAVVWDDKTASVERKGDFELVFKN